MPGRLAALGDEHDVGVGLVAVHEMAEALRISGVSIAFFHSQS